MTGITVNIEQGIATITLGEQTTFNPAVREAFADAIKTVKDSEEAQVLLLTGTGKNFCQGLDLEYLGSSTPDDIFEHVNRCMLEVAELMTLGIPTVALINGHAFGLGAMLVMACDYAAMRTERGFFCLPEVNLHMALIPSMNSLVTESLSRKALRECLFAGTRVVAEKAVELEIVDQSCDVDRLRETGLALAAPMIGKDKPTLAKLKQDAHHIVLDAIYADAPK